LLIFIAVIELPKTFSAASLPRSLRSSEGRRFTLRRLKADDAEAFAQFISGLDPESIRLRFGYTLAGMTKEGALRYTALDPKKDSALGVFEKLERRSELVATGHALTLPKGGSAEIFFAVKVGSRRMGLATVLLEALMVLSRQLGLTQLTAQTHCDNYPMLSVLIRHGGHLTPIRGTEGIDVDLAL
jgi:acetyltransferase